MREGKADGTVRDHLERAAKRPGKAGLAARAELAAHPCPPVFRSLWRHFTTLSAWRGAGGMSAAPITFADIESYESRFGVRFLPGVLDLIKRLDFETLSTASA